MKLRALTIVDAGLADATGAASSPMVDPATSRTVAPVTAVRAERVDRLLQAARTAGAA